MLVHITENNMKHGWEIKTKEEWLEEVAKCSRATGQRNFKKAYSGWRKYLRQNALKPVQP